MGKLAEQFGQGIRARRKSLRLTQGQLGEASGLSEEWVRRLERGAGAPSFDALEALAAALGTSVGELFAPMSSRDAQRVVLDALVADLSEVELAWIYTVIRAALSRPPS